MNKVDMIMQMARKIIFCGANKIIIGVLEFPDMIILKLPNSGMAGPEWQD